MTKFGSPKHTHMINHTPSNPKLRLLNKIILLTCYLLLYGSEAYAFSHFISLTPGISFHLYVWHAILGTLLVIRIMVVKAHPKLHSCYHPKLLKIDWMVVGTLTGLIVITTFGELFPEYALRPEVISLILIGTSGFIISRIGNVITEMYQEMNNSDD